MKDLSQLSDKELFKIWRLGNEWHTLIKITNKNLDQVDIIKDFGNYIRENYHTKQSQN